MSQIRRRALLGSAALTSLAWPLSAGRLLAEPPGQGKPALVVVFLRGAMDSLQVVAPAADRHYQALRPTLGLLPPDAKGPAQNRSVNLDGRHALHPNLAPLLQHKQELAVVIGTGLPKPLRSHFDAQLVMERFAASAADLGPAGWLTRLQGSLGEAGARSALSIGNALPHAFAGANAIAYGQGGAGGGRRRALFRSLYAPSPSDTTAQRVVRQLGLQGIDAVEHFRRLEVQHESPAQFHGDPLSRVMKRVSALLRGEPNLQLVTVDHGSWDTHRNQAGMLGQRTRELGQALGAFWQSLGAHRSRVLVLTMTEFGRTAAPNGTGGTDHGWGSAMFLLGQHLRPGVLGTPSYAPGDLEAGRDLRVTTDYRNVLAEVATRHFGVARGHYPDQTPLPGLFR